MNYKKNFLTLFLKEKPVQQAIINLIENRNIDTPHDIILYDKNSSIKKKDLLSTFSLDSRKLILTNVKPVTKPYITISEYIVNKDLATVGLVNYEQEEYISFYLKRISTTNRWFILDIKKGVTR